MKLSLQNNELERDAGKETGGNQLFPVFLKLNELHTVLVGAGNVGLEKLTAILHNSPNARVTIIAKEVLPEINNLANNTPGLKIFQKSFNDYDLDNADVV